MSEDGNWDYREDGEDDDEHDVDKYSEGSNNTGNTTAPNVGGFERPAPWIPDAFRGHHCPVCLGPAEDSAMIETCHHIFCESCLFEWLTISDRCPLCKIQVTRVLHEIKSPREYKVHVHVKRTGGGGARAGGGSSSSAMLGTLNELAPRSRDDEGAGRGCDSSSSSGGSRIRGGKFRSLVYRRNLAAEPPEAKARRPKAVDQLRTWIFREVQAAAADKGTGGGDMRLLADVVEALLKDKDMDDQEGYCRVKEQAFLFENTGPFLHELWCFRWSRLGMPAYDRDTVYSARPA